MTDVFKKKQIGQMVAYVKRIDTQTDQESPNIDPAVITQVHSDGSVDLFVMHSNGSYSLQNVSQGENRGEWYFIRLKDGANG